MQIPQGEPDHNSALGETLRLDALQRLFILDTPPEPDCDEITQLTATVFPSCNALLTFVDESRVWIKSRTRTIIDSAPRHLTLCTIGLEQAGCTVFLDIKKDVRIPELQDLYATHGLRFYAGAPLMTRDGNRVGMLCILDTKPWESFSHAQEHALIALASLASDRLELRGMQYEAQASERMSAPDIRNLGERMLSLVPENRTKVQARTRLKHELAHGIEHGEMELHYQPEVDLESRVVVGFEALVRWRHPSRGLLLPGEFIPLAEETGLVNPLGDWALREACRQALVWSLASAERLDLRVSVNLSATHFESPDLFEHVASLLDETGLYPEELRLEVTETSLLSSADIVLTTMKRLRDIGVGLHMDDFGTGYSSLHTLHRFPFDTIKIDRSFVSRVADHDASLQIVKTILTLCRSLNMEVVAEGIETQRQAQILCAAGCHYGQGHFFSPPLHPSEVVEMLNRQMDGIIVPGDLQFQPTHSAYLCPKTTSQQRHF